MPPQTLLNRARQAWAGQASVPLRFPPDGTIDVGVSADSNLSPPGWIGLVVLGDAGIAAVPRPNLRDIFAGRPIETATEIGRLSPREVIGPATLAFLDETDFRPVEAEVQAVAPGHQDLAGLVGSVTPEDAREAGLEYITSPVFTVRNQDSVIAAAGYELWPGSVAHVCVLTAPAHRGRGLAQAVASAATREALRNGLFPQWRARPAASRRVAQRLGFRELGAQISFRVED